MISSVCFCRFLPASCLLTEMSLSRCSLLKGQSPSTQRTSRMASAFRHFQAFLKRYKVICLAKPQPAFVMSANLLSACLSVASSVNSILSTQGTVHCSGVRHVQCFTRTDLQAAEDTYIQLEFWDENIDLIRRSAAIIRKAGREHRVIVGAPQNAKIWKMCGQEMPEASRILPDSEVIPSPEPACCRL